MPAITLRNLPHKLTQAIWKLARERHTSLNRAVIGLLEERLGLARQHGTTLHHDLDQLAGAWTPQEAAVFNKWLAQQRALDDDLWR
jgi:hypothetical protein